MREGRKGEGRERRGGGSEGGDFVGRSIFTLRVTGTHMPKTLP